jgi:hypothetical protein
MDWGRQVCAYHQTNKTNHGREKEETMLPALRDLLQSFACLSIYVVISRFIDHVSFYYGHTTTASHHITRNTFVVLQPIH